jgi:hypothetical protein
VTDEAVVHDIAAVDVVKDVTVVATTVTVMLLPLLI